MKSYTKNKGSQYFRTNKTTIKKTKNETIAPENQAYTKNNYACNTHTATNNSKRKRRAKNKCKHSRTHNQ